MSLSEITQPFFLKVVTGGCRHMRYLVTQGTCGYFHALIDTGHLVDLERMRSSHVHNHRRTDDTAISKPHTTNPSVLFDDLGDLGIEAELGATIFRGTM